jgi:pyruvate ferredoxin oxidoreductase gamma subunit
MVYSIVGCGSGKLKLINIKFFGRGGQGVVTAANILVRAAFMSGLWGQSYPFFGAERRGAPVTAYVRLSKDRIRLRSTYMEPDIVIVFDDKLVNILDIYSGVKDEGIIIINTSDDIRHRKYKVFKVDASGIARKLGLVFAGWPLVNMPMLGAFSKVTKLVSIDNVVESIKEYFRGHSSKEFLEANITSVKIAYDEVREVV